MSIYLDSSALIKLYVPEAESISVQNYLSGVRGPLWFSQLHELELKNGLQLKLFRKETVRRPVGEALKLINSDLSSGILVRPPLNWPEVFECAVSLANRYSASNGCRSLDLLHVASAILLQTTAFLTFDTRQAVAAAKAGVQLVRF